MLVGLLPETGLMDLAFSPDELRFCDEVRAFLRTQLPEDLSEKVMGSQRLSREDFLR